MPIEQVMVTGWRAPPTRIAPIASCSCCTAPFALRNSRSPSAVKAMERWPRGQELDAQQVLERTDLSTDRRLRDAKIVRRERDAHAAPYRHAAPDQVERRETRERNRHSNASWRYGRLDPRPPDAASPSGVDAAPRNPPARCSAAQRPASSAVPTAIVAAAK